MDPGALLAMMKSRRSIRRYTDQPVPEAVVRRILEAGRWGPSAHNRQPWRFAVLVDANTKQALARAMGEQFRHDLAADELAPEHVERQVARSYARISSAPVVLVLFMSMADMDRYSDAKQQQAERIMAIQSVSLAAQNMLLMACAQGLGACWMCAPLFCPNVVRDVLDLPADWEAQGLITLGYAAEQRTRERAPLEAFIRWYQDRA